MLFDKELIYYNMKQSLWNEKGGQKIAYVLTGIWQVEEGRRQKVELPRYAPMARVMRCW